MQITLHTNAAAFDALANEWKDLMERAKVAPIFMTPDYQKIWWEHLGKGELRILAAREPETGQLTGIASLFLVNRELHFVGCVDVSDYLDFIIDPRYCAPVFQAIVDYLAVELAPEWDKGFFCSLSEKSSTLKILVERVQAKGWAAEIRHEDVCPIITLPATWDDYLAGVKKKQRHEIRRKLRKAENAAQTRWYVIEDPADLSDDLIDTFIDLHQKSTVEKEAFWDDAMIAFFKALVKRFAQLRWLKFYFVEMNGKPASTLLCFDYGNEILVYNSGFDVAEFGHLSPGNIIISYSIQHAIELGRARYDFLRGDEIYKFRFGAVAEDVLGVRVTKNQTI